MRIVTTPALVTALCVLVTGCTATNSSNPQSAAIAPSSIDYLTADQIRNTIIGNTIEGVAYYKRYGNIPFKMHFEKGTRIYRDRSVIRNNPTTAFGSYRIIEDGQLCRTSKSRRQGRETCFRFSVTNGVYKVVEGNTAFKISIVPGRAVI